MKREPCKAALRFHQPPAGRTSPAFPARFPPERARPAAVSWPRPFPAHRAEGAAGSEGAARAGEAEPPPWASGSTRRTKCERGERGDAGRGRAVRGRAWAVPQWPLCLAGTSLAPSTRSSTAARKQVRVGLGLSLRAPGQRVLSSEPRAGAWAREVLGNAAFLATAASWVCARWWGRAWALIIAFKLSAVALSELSCDLFPAG